MIGNVEFESKIKRIRSSDHKGAQETAKKELPAVAVSGIFHNGVRRNDNLREYSGCIQIDIDNQPDQIDRIRREIVGDPYILVGFVSPSGGGFKMIIQTDGDVEDHDFACTEVFRYIETTYKVKADHAVRDLPRLMFFSYDPNCYHNPDAQAFPIKQRLKSPISGISDSQMILQRPQDVDPENFEKIQQIHLKLQARSQYVVSNRNNHMHKFASWLNNDGIERELAEAVIYSNFDLPRSELRQCILSAYKRTDQFGQNRNIANVATPKKLEDDDLPQFPEEVYDALPKQLREALQPLNDRKDQRDVLFLSLLVAHSAAIPRNEIFYENQKTGGNLYCCVAGPAESGKGIMRLARTVAEGVEELMKEQFKSEYRDYKIRLRMCEKDENCDPDEIAKVRERKFIIPGNSSEAAIMETLQANDGIGYMNETEVDTVSGATEQKWGLSSQVLRDSYDHSTISANRKTGIIEISNPHLSISMSGTFNQIKRFFGSPENGLVSRFLFYVLKGKREWRNPFSSDNQEIIDRIDGLRKDFRDFYQYYSDNPIEFVLTPDQINRFNQFFRKLLKSSDSDSQESTIFRLGLNAARLAMVLTSIRSFFESSGERVCSEKDFMITLKIIETLHYHALYIIDMLENSSKVRRIDSFYDRLPDSFTTGEAKKLGFRDRTVDFYIKKLSEAGKIKPIDHGKFIKVNS
jgi:hypothetical protein